MHPSTVGTAGLLPGEQLLGTQLPARHRLRTPVRRKRPKVPLPGVLPAPGPRTAKGFILSADYFLNPADLLTDLIFRRPSHRYVRAPIARAFRRLKDSNALITRRRGTEADRLLCALNPRGRVRPRVELECTDRRLRLVYRWSAPHEEATATTTAAAPLAQPAWEAPLSDLAWIRPRRDGPASLHEFGFTDGSWISLDLVHRVRHGGWREFIALFPPHLVLPAAHNPSRNLARTLRQEWSSRRARPEAD